MTGVIKRLVPEKGFGFVRDGGGLERFFHRSAVVDDRFDDLREGQTVSFEDEKSDKGPRASHVRAQ